MPTIKKVFFLPEFTVKWKIKEKKFRFLYANCVVKKLMTTITTQTLTPHISQHTDTFFFLYFFFHHIVVKITHFLPQNMQIRFCTRQEPLKHIVKCCNCVHYISCSIMSNIEIRISNSKFFKIIFINTD